MPVATDDYCASGFSKIGPCKTHGIVCNCRVAKGNYE